MSTTERVNLSVAVGDSLACVVYRGRVFNAKGDASFQIWLRWPPDKDEHDAQYPKNESNGICCLWRHRNYPALASNEYSVKLRMFSRKFFV